MVKRERFITNPGSRVRITRSGKVNANGSIDVVETGKEDFQSYIDSFADSCNINNIIARYRAGDMSALNAMTPMYGDFTIYPKTYAEMLQKMIDGQRFFETLPAEIKSKFGNDFNRFFQASGDDDFLEKLGIKPNVPGEIIKEENEEVIEK